MKEVDALVKKLDSTDNEDNFLRFIAELHEDTKEFELANPT